MYVIWIHTYIYSISRGNGAFVRTYAGLVQCIYTILHFQKKTKTVKHIHYWQRVESNRDHWLSLSVFIIREPSQRENAFTQTLSYITPPLSPLVRLCLSLRHFHDAALECTKRNRETVQDSAGSTPPTRTLVWQHTALYVMMGMPYHSTATLLHI